MKLFKILVIAAMAPLVYSSAVIAGDFGWTNVFDFEAYTDPLELRTRLASRFHIDDNEINALLSTFDSPADAYIILRLGEMSERPPGYVVDKYRHNKGRGWDALALGLGIKPGSEEFHALKLNHDLHPVNNFDRVVDSVYDSGNDNYAGSDYMKGDKRNLLQGKNN